MPTPATGNAVNVWHTLRAFERAGVGGLMLEDQVWPKRCGHMKGKEVISAEEMVQKIHAAAEARIDPDFVIKSRTDVLATHGVKEAIRRLNLMAEAGADLLFADAATSVEDIATIARNVSKPMSVNMGFGIRQRRRRRSFPPGSFRISASPAVIYPRLLTACALRGMQRGPRVPQESLDTGQGRRPPEALVSFEELHEIMGIDDVSEPRAALPHRRAARGEVRRERAVRCRLRKSPRSIATAPRDAARPAARADRHSGARSAT
jgi:2-methylisocitrate lyase-like PEP mutase family enzyme